MPTLAEILRERLLAGRVHFIFQKVDGTIREADGTLNRSVYAFPVPAGSSSSSDSVVPYWDLDKNAWRCCRADSIISIG